MRRHAVRNTVIILATLATLGAAAATGPEILEFTDTRGGVVVQIGCGNVGLIRQLRAGPAFRVQALDTVVERVTTARRTLTETGDYGPITARVFDGVHLPYADSMINLLVAEDPDAVSTAELQRVLAPGGAAWIDGAVVRRPRPGAIDEWTHYLHGPDNNAVSSDRLVDTPRRLQWTAGPPHTRDHDALASMSAMTSSAGRLFYILDEGPTGIIHRPPRWRLIARDAFNGVLLWKRQIPDWVTHLQTFRTGPAHLTRRLVSVGDRVYTTLGLSAPVTALDAATGETVLTYRNTEQAEEMLVVPRGGRSVLLTVTGDSSIYNEQAPHAYGYWELSVANAPRVQRTLRAHDAGTGDLLWEVAGESMGRYVPLSLTARGDRVVYLDNRELHCLSLADGGEVWRAPFATPGGFLRSYTPTVVMADNTALSMHYDKLHAYDVADGRLLWKRKGAIGFGAAGDLFVIDGLVWTVPLTAGIKLGESVRNGRVTNGPAMDRNLLLGNGGSEIWGMDLRTGVVKRSMRRDQVLPGGHHHRCYRNKATERFLICGRRGVEFVDLTGDRHRNNWWVRGICQYGIMPANGLTYVPPDPCQCFNLVKVNGFLALAHRTSFDDGPEPTPRVVRGPAFGRSAIPALPAWPSAPPAGALVWQPPCRTAAADWPTYRADITRCGSTPAPVPDELQLAWRVRLGDRADLTAPVIADGRLVVADKAHHLVHCLDVASGERLWRRTVSGSVDSPPTLSQGLCVFGGRDGSVTCLDVRTGQLVWQFQLDARCRQIMDDGRLESVWPIHGSVLVLDGAVYAAAGRSSYLDGGIRLIRLDLRTGELQRETTLSASSSYAGGGPPDPASVGALPDLLVSDGQVVTMRQVQFTRDLERIDPPRPVKVMICNMGMLNDTWFNRTNWVLGFGRAGSQRHAPWVQQIGTMNVKNRAMVAGKLIAFDADRAVEVTSPYSSLKRSQAMWPDTHDGHLHQKYSRYPEEFFPVGTQLSSHLNRPPAKARTACAEHVYDVRMPYQPRAMVLSPSHVFLAGREDRLGVSEQHGAPLDAAAEARPASSLRVVRAEDGETIREYRLPAEPVFDGLAAAAGRLFLALRDGSLACFGPSGEALAAIGQTEAPASYFLNPEGYASHDRYFFKPVPREGAAAPDQGDRPNPLQTVSPGDDGTLSLAAANAALKGRTFWLKRPDGTRLTVTRWTNPGDYLEWRVVLPAGHYRAAVRYAAASGDTVYELTLGESAHKLELPRTTGGWGKASMHEAGTIVVGETGPVRARLRPVPESHKPVNLWALELTPTTVAPVQ